MKLGKKLKEFEEKKYKQDLVRSVKEDFKQRQRERGLHNNPFQNKHHSLETKQKISIKKKGQPSKRKREIYINGIKYESVRKAMQLLNISTIFAI